MKRLGYAFLFLIVTYTGRWSFAEPPLTMSLVPVSREPSRFKEIDKLVQDALLAGEMAGAVVVIASKKEVLYANAFGDRQAEPIEETMTLDSVFDLASLTKPVSTATSIMILVDRGRIKIDEPVHKYLSAFRGQGKEDITVEQLLRHTSGLIPDNPLKDYESGLERAWQNIFELKPISTPGKKFAYSDVNFIVLGKIVEELSGCSLDQFTTENIFQPLGMKETMYNPIEVLRSRAVATEKRDGIWLKGIVHDPRAALMKGVAGHAGLFSTAADLVVFGQMLLGRGQRADIRILSEQVFDLMRTPQSPEQAIANTNGGTTIVAGELNGPSKANSKSSRALGWDHRSAYSSNRGKEFSESAFGHGGFTGTVFWIDPEKDRIFIFLSTRLHPDGKGTINPLAGEIANIIGKQ